MACRSEDVAYGIGDFEPETPDSEGDGLLWYCRVASYGKYTIERDLMTDDIVIIEHNWNQSAEADDTEIICRFSDRDNSSIANMANAERLIEALKR